MPVVTVKCFQHLPHQYVFGLLGELVIRLVSLHLLQVSTPAQRAFSSDLIHALSSGNFRRSCTALIVFATCLLDFGMVLMLWFLLGCGLLCVSETEKFHAYADFAT